MTNKRAITYYLLTPLILAVYGGEVCPFLESLSFSTLLTILLCGFIATYVLRHLTLSNIAQKAKLSGVQKGRFRTEFILFLASGTTLTVYNYICYGFPLLSGLKLITGCATIGFFASTDLALGHEYQYARKILMEGRRLTLDHVRTSLARKFSLFAVAGVTSAVIVMILILTKDLAWLSMFGPEGLHSATQAVWKEIVFVGSVFLILLIVVISSFSRNINVFLENEASVLDNVTQGKLDRYVPVSTDDEFGIIATQTNLMIDGLRERNRIKNMFGKFLNPKIADALLIQGEDELKLGGSKRDLVILVSDVRDFTSASETSTPEQTVTNLNIYFSRMVEIVHRNGGIVDKFLGDGMLAYFGLEDSEKAAARALRSAVQMQQAMEDVNKSLSSPFRIGIGLHSGEVIAGKIGSDEKLEFTVIGDAVNTASRLEGLNKDLDTAILVSEVIHNRLSLSELMLPWVDMGEQILKGKGRAVKVFGVRYENITTMCSHTSLASAARAPD